MFKYIDDVKDFLDNVIIEATAHVESGDQMLANSGRVVLGLASIMSLVIGGASLENRPVEAEAEAEAAPTKTDTIE